MEKELVSIIIPVYQVKPYLGKCIESVIHQTYRNIEIILIDDGSTDGSSEICDTYRDVDHRIIVIHQENMGLSAARNSGIQIAKGIYYAFVDSDDWVRSDYIEVLYRSCKNNDADIAQCGYYAVIDEDRAETDNINSAFAYSPEEFSIAEFTILSWNCNLTWNKLYRAILFREIEFPVGRIHEDEFTTYKLIWKANKIMVNTAKLYYYRQRQDSITGSEYSLKRLDAGFAFQEKIEFYESIEKITLALMNRRKYLFWIKEQIRLVTSLAQKDNSVINYLEREKVKNERILSVQTMPVKRYGSCEFIFPFNMVRKGSKVLLYGAGNVGRQFYRQVTTLNYCEIVGWIDGNAEQYRQEGMQVEKIETIERRKMDYDVIVIAIESMETAKSIGKKLVEEYKVLRDKLVYQIERI